MRDFGVKLLNRVDIQNFFSTIPCNLGIKLTVDTSGGARPKTLVEFFFPTN